MEDREFFDTLYSEWSKTTGAGERYLIVEKVEYDPDLDYMTSWDVWAISFADEGDRTLVATFEKEADADFFAAVHGCFGDLVRRLHEALDEADRADERRDEAEGQLAEEIMLNQELTHRLEGLEH
ncbi:hypothetical protein SEA_LASTRESORT_41 [Gordonia phage LastResort]|uniref:hypothetical protein n=1 Tax=Gordonia phage Rosalind TaxID=1838077 RepID=UPI0007B6213B|nr:hypothetical protein BEN61_gp070 [Gordonia phage Rosalind]AXH47839.1 hypothetical protein SEA_LASTRESORT_41 [Gordonia phage LastResort]QDM56217.1 hypothetical protein SEA_REMO_41 [Gordonia phage ReMo]QLF84914.1 hypothetical protein SEA_EPSOCAMISIO_41 [Gordonia phage Epsocamisio]QZD98690.1 hypothetical protein SEA_LOOPER_42 [Gordonia phage Looper]WKW87354.1 hypothetical protein SEA_NEBULOSUS_41 [Gordonia phage Nebulosus]